MPRYPAAPAHRPGKPALGYREGGRKTNTFFFLKKKKSVLTPALTRRPSLVAELHKRKLPGTAVPRCGRARRRPGAPPRPARGQPARSSPAPGRRALLHLPPCSPPPPAAPRLLPGRPVPSRPERGPATALRPHLPHSRPRALLRSSHLAPGRGPGRPWAVLLSAGRGGVGAAVRPGGARPRGGGR